MKLIDRLNYEAVELKFGTSGLRALVTDMTDLECYINTRGFLKFLNTQNKLNNTGSVLIGGDLRESTPRIMQAVAKAVEDHGLAPVYCGLLPTPALALEALRQNVPAIMVTGSHIPADRNGIKFYKPDGEVLKSDESAIFEAVSALRQEVYAQEDTIFAADGSLQEVVDWPEENSGAKQRFTERCEHIASDNFLSEKKIVVYQQSAVGRDMLVGVLEHYGAKVIPADRSDTFVPIDTENVTPENERYFKKLAQEHKDAFAIVSTDGDSDRPFVIDENGTFHRGDVLGVLVSELLEADAVAVPVSSNDAIDERLAKKDVAISRTKIGSPHVIVAMQELAKSHSRVMGWEVNGGFLTHGSLALQNGTELQPLPTRDAFLPIIAALQLAVDRGVSLSDLFGSLPARYTQAGLIDDFEQADSQKIISAFTDEKKARELVGSVFVEQFNFEKCIGIDMTDGAQLRFANNEVFHIRPSGNAPQLRVYAMANSQKRADELVATGIREPDGVLRCLQDAVKN